MTRTEKRKTGDLGEGVAAAFFEKHGFRILARNYQKKWGELDIVAEKDGVIHFIEVKTVTRIKDINTRIGTNETNDANKISDEYEAEDNVHPWKLKRLYRTIETYLLEKKVPDDAEYQLDLIVVTLASGKETAHIRYLPDI